MENFRICGRYFYHKDILYLGSSGAFIEFEGNITRLEFDISPLSPVPGLECIFNIYVNDMDTPVCKVKGDGPRHIDLSEYIPESNGSVRVRVLKITEAQYGACGICGIHTDGEIRPTKPADKQLFVIGHSLVAGYGIDDNPKPMFTTDEEDFSLTYSYLVGQLMGADVTALGYSGSGIISRWISIYDEVPDTENLIPQVYPYTEYYLGSRLFGKDNPIFDPSTYHPDMILINVGANDASYIRGVEERAALYIEKYTDFVCRVAGDYPDTDIILLDGFTELDRINEAKAVTEACRNRGLRVRFIELKKQDKYKNGTGNMGHPTAASHREAAEDLYEKLKS